jgi:serine/threonine protein kinase
MKNKFQKSNKINKLNKTNKLNKKTKNIGGNILASGGFGCVFSPALKCEGEMKRENNKISKLMTETHAKEEYEEIVSIKEKIDNIPNYKDYFLLYDINLCKPARLTETDLSNFTKKCKALPKDNITKDNINSKLSETMILNMPNGGMAVDDFLYKHGSIQNMREINKSLRELLKNGIIPMNKKYIYHSDIKDSNILVDNFETSIKTKLIDWGLSTEYTPFKNEPFPRTWRNRPFQFNVPFSVIIFSEDFIEKYTKYIEDGGEIEKEHLQEFVILYILFWMKKRGPGHYRFINEIMYMLFSKSLNGLSQSELKVYIETEFTMPYITDYIVEILLHFTKFRENGTLNLREYLDNIFIKNVDLWGFCSSYFPYLELLFNNYKKLNENEVKLFNLVKQIFITIYTTRTTEISHTHIFGILENIDNILEKISDIPVSINKVSSIKKLKTTHTKKIRRNTKKTNSNISFKNRPQLKNFKNPIFLSVK